MVIKKLAFNSNYLMVSVMSFTQPALDDPIDKKPMGLDRASVGTIYLFPKFVPNFLLWIAIAVRRVTRHPAGNSICCNQ